MQIQATSGVDFRSALPVSSPPTPARWRRRRPCEIDDSSPDLSPMMDPDGGFTSGCHSFRTGGIATSSISRRDGRPRREVALRGWHRHPAEVANKTPARYWRIVNAMSVVYPRTLPQLPDCIPHPMHHQPTKPSTKSPPGGLPSHFRSTSGSLPVYFRFTSGSLPVEISVQLTKKFFFHV